jgi:hypothetical protein
MPLLDCNLYAEMSNAGLWQVHIQDVFNLVGFRFQIFQSVAKNLGVLDVLWISCHNGSPMKKRGWLMLCNTDPLPISVLRLPYSYNTNSM